MSRSLPAVNKRGSQVPVSRGSVLTSSRASLLPPIEATPSRPVKTRGSLQPDIPEGPGGVSPSGPAFRRVSFSPTAADQQPEHIETTLSQLKLFKDMDSTVLKMLPEIVTSILCKAGTVLFKQGDPPGSCYVVIGGAVGVHVLSDEEGLPSNQPQEKHRFTTVKESGFLQDFLPGQRTVDGFSRYHEDTNFGNRLSQLGPGSVLGELALINDQPRLASAKCVEDSEFFVIRRNDFDNVLKEEMVKKGDEKLRFLMKHLPGMKEVPVPKPGGKLHASYMFKHAKFTRGHTFLVQGKIAEPHIWAVYKGSVEFRRAEVLSPEKAGGECSMPQLRARPLSALKPGLRKKMPGAASQPRLHGIGRDGNVAAEANDSNPNGVMSRRGVLVVGGVFGSLPFPAPEPFTVRVTSPICEVFFITSADFAKLPRKLLDVVQEYVASSTTWRLSCHQRSTNFRKQGFKRHAPIFDQEEDATDVDTIQEESSVDVNELLEECREERKSQFEHFRKAAFEGT